MSLMKVQRFNWYIWAAFLLSVAALISYPFVFVRFPITRDFPWVNLLLFAIAAALVFVGLKCAFAPGRPRRSKIAASILATLSILVFGLFVFSIFIAARWLPSSIGAPHVGQKAPDFKLPDSNGRIVSLSEVLTEPIDGKAPRGVLLIFYRGYW